MPRTTTDDVDAGRTGRTARTGVWRRVRTAGCDGPWVLACRLVRRLALRPICRRWLAGSVIELMHVTVAEHKRFRRVPGTYDVRRAGHADIAALVELFSDASPRQSRAEAGIRARLDRDDVCLVAMADGRACAGVWLVPGAGTYDEDLQESGCLYRVPAGAAWTYDGRGRKLGAWGCLMAHLPGQLDALGLDEIYTAIDLGNRLSRESHVSLGYKRTALLTRLSLFGLSLLRCRPVGGRWRRLPAQVAGLGLEKKVRCLRRVPRADTMPLA